MPTKPTKPSLNSDPVSLEQLPARPPKKPYSPPVLTQYGTVENLTRSVANAGSLDNGAGATTKTQFGPAGGARRR
jgi:hypothetical protein